VKTAERLEARRLRAAEGCSIREIAQRVGVSRSSASLWVRDVELTPPQVDALRGRDPRFDASRNGSAANAERARARRIEAQHEGQRRARGADRRYAAGCMLYWAEGSRARNSVRFTNSDPEMMR
jgi:transcriptional regulator with XRE-family HTH domain